VNSGSTDGRSYCPSTTQSAAGTPPTESNTFAPLADSSTAITDKLTATNDGNHILGAHAIPGGTPTLNDITVTLPVNKPCPFTVSVGYFPSSHNTLPLTPITASAITGLFPTSGQVPPPVNPTTPIVVSPTQIAQLTNEVTFVTYATVATPLVAASPAQLPEYAIPSTGGAGTVSYVQLTGAATAPISGVWSTDNNTFYTGTSGDNLVHEITQSCTAITPTPPASQPPYTCVWKDSGQITPNLPSATGSGTVPVNLIAQKPKRVTS
jgi:hypothetical protein